MNASDELLVQRYHDGELTRAEVATVERALAERPSLRLLSQRMSGLDTAMRACAVDANRTAADPGQIIARVMERLPQRAPQRHLHLSGAQLAVASVALVTIGFGYAITDAMRDLLPVGAVAAASALIGVILIIAARPLMALEASLFARLMRQRLAVGDGEVLVCRVLGVALIIGGIHVIGLWG